MEESEAREVRADLKVTQEVGVVECATMAEDRAIIIMAALVMAVEGEVGEVTEVVVGEEEVEEATAAVGEGEVEVEAMAVVVVAVGVSFSLLSQQSRRC